MKRTRGPHGTECKIYVDGLHGLREGDYITTRGGSGYFVLVIRQSPTIRCRRYLRVLRWDVDKIPPGARRFQIVWYPRNKKHGKVRL